jgi:hypothetical protein
MGTQFLWKRDRKTIVSCGILQLALSGRVELELEYHAPAVEEAPMAVKRVESGSASRELYVASVTCVMSMGTEVERMGEGA